MKTIINTTGTLYNNSYFRNIGITEKSAFLYGVDKSEIKNIAFEVSEDQSEPLKDSIEYWGWFDNEKQDWTFIYPNYWQLYACFPYGLPKHEEAGDGKAYRLNLIINEIIVSERNRDGAKIWFERIEDNNFIIKSDKDWVLEYMRYIYTDVPNDAIIFDFEYNNKKGIYNAIDPSGGPYISVGDEFETVNGKYKLSRIFNKNNDTIFVLQNNI